MTSQARTIRRLELRTAQGKFELFAGERGFQSQAERARPPTKADGLPDVLSLLTPEQYRLITFDRDSPVIIQGRAGSGKTTVALYRVSWLTFADEEAAVPPIDLAKVLIVMFNKALSSFVRKGLTALHLQDVQLDTFHAWALHEIRRSYRGTIEIDSSKRPGQAVAGALKKQLGMIAALDAFVGRQTAALETWLEEKLRPYGGALWLKRYRSSTAPVVRRLVQLRSQALDERDKSRAAELELDRAAHVCVVCRNKTDAERVHAALTATLSDLDTPVRLGHSKRFEFTPGITVTNAQQVKGLEFDVVIVFDPSPERYPARTDARRALYMVLTRAKERLHFVGHGEVSPLLQSALERGWIELRQKPSVPPVLFTEEDEDPF